MIKISFEQYKQIAEQKANEYAKRLIQKPQERKEIEQEYQNFLSQFEVEF